MPELPELLESYWLLGLVALVVLIALVRALMPRRKPAGAFIEVVCNECGWRGTVGKYNRRCSQCGAAVGGSVAD